jgi:hypothetical protein
MHPSAHVAELGSCRLALPVLMTKQGSCMKLARMALFTSRRQHLIRLLRIASFRALSSRAVGVRHSEPLFADWAFVTAVKSRLGLCEARTRNLPFFDW